jgi:hypothetical protein
VVIAASFTLGLSCLGPYAHAGLLGGDDSDSPTVEGMALPLGGDVVGGLLGGGLGGLAGGDLVGGLIGTVVGGDLLGADLLGEGVPLVSNLVGGLLAGDEGILAAEGITEVLPNLDILPGLGVISEILGAYSDSGSIVPGLQVLDEFGFLGMLGSL